MVPHPESTQLEPVTPETAPPPDEETLPTGRAVPEPVLVEPAPAETIVAGPGTAEAAFPALEPHPDLSEDQVGEPRPPEPAGAEPAEATAAPLVPRPEAGVPPEETAAPLHVESAHVSPAEEEQPRPAEEPAPERIGAPNWMLAFVCAWAGATSLFEAWNLATESLAAHTLAITGYGTLGVGLILFGIEALQWGRRRSSAAAVVAVVLPTLLTLAGVLCLVMSNEPGRRI